MENVKFAIALRGGRAMLGWGQQEFAERLNVAKSTVARIETLEMAPKAEFLLRALQLFKNAGILIDLTEGDKVSFTVVSNGVEEAASRLADDGQRRSDRKIRNARGTIEVATNKKAPLTAAKRVKAKLSDAK